MSKLIQHNKKKLIPIKITHQGKWNLFGELEIECYVTSNHQRLLSLRGTARAMDLRGRGSRALVEALSLKWIQPYLSEQLKDFVDKASTNEIEQIRVMSGPAIVPFQTSLFIDICKAYILANDDGILSEAGKRTYSRLLSIMTAFAKVGIDSLVDEITGYQKERQDNELQRILSKYLCEEFLEWSKMFPDEFYEQMFRLREWDSFKKGGQKMPGVVGYFTNDIVYERLPAGVLEALKEKVPKSEAGNNVLKLHQGLSEDYGRKHLEKHLIAVIAIMKSSESWNQFLYMLDKSYQKRGQNVMRFF